MDGPVAMVVGSLVPCRTAVVIECERRAQAIRREGKRVNPAGAWAYFASIAAAGLDLGQHRPLDPVVAEKVERELEAWGLKGGDVDWWLEARLHQLDLDEWCTGADPVCSCGQRVPPVLGPPVKKPKAAPGQGTLARGGRWGGHRSKESL